MATPEKYFDQVHRRFEDEMGFMKIDVITAILFTLNKVVQNLTQISGLYNYGKSVEFPI